MASILVVDDALADRRLAGGLLEKVADWSITYAENGMMALEQLEDQVPDLVLTDLQMPHVNGFELVAAVQASHPLIPIILMTARGSEEIAVKALELGAASYVPKPSLSRDLVETVKRVLASASARRNQHRLMTRMNQAVFVLENDLELISSLASYLRQTVLDRQIFSETDSLRVATALDEALTNAYYHGNLEVSSELRNKDHSAYRELAEQRRRQLPFRDRRIHVQSTFADGEATFLIRDEGPGFDRSQLPDPSDPENLDRPSGRGIFLMNCFMDEIIFNDVGNEVTMIKRRSSEDAETLDEET